MKLIDIVSGPWAIKPEMLEEIQHIYATHLRGEKIDIEAVEARIGRPLDNTQSAYSLIEGVAVLPLEGVVGKRMNLFTQISGGVSTDLAKQQIAEALEDSAVEAVILQVDSPGGTVDGTAELADFIYQSRGDKPIYALADGLMASAAMWFGSAADKVFIKDNTTMTGSIGVVASHFDISKWEEKVGVKTTEISAGKYKRISSQYAPLSEEGRADIQAKVDYLYSVFVDAVARNRGVDVETVLTNMADGRVFVGRQAVAAGLVDGVSTLEDLIVKIKNDDEAGAGAVAANKKKEQDMKIENVDQLRAAFPDLVKDVEAAAREGYVAEADIEEKTSTAKTEGAEQERQRIQDVEAQTVRGHEKLITELKFDGKTTGPEAAVKVLEAVKSEQARNLKGYQDDAPDPLAPSGDAGNEGKPQGTIEERAKAEWDQSEDLQAEFSGNFDRFMAWKKAEKDGRARVLKK